jgi:N-acetylmuramoyl-L-alanine amidase
MRVAFARVLLLGWLLAGSAIAASGAPASLPVTLVGGRSYVSLADWARANRLSAQWIKRDEAVEVIGPKSRAVFQVQAPEAHFDGVAVRLLSPLFVRNGVVYLSVSDAQKVFRPLFYPPQLKPGRRLRTICLDPGHGGRDPGFQIAGHQEKQYTLLFAQELRQQLRRAGWKVHLTRTTDTLVDLPLRPRLAAQRKADLFLSLHFNAAANTPLTAQGCEVYSLTPAGAASSNSGGEGGGTGAFAGNRFDPENLALAYQLQRALVRGVALQDRGVRWGRFWVLRDATMPAVLVEAGFMSHPVEGGKILSAAHRQQLARAVVQGLTNYKRLVETAR